MFLTVLERSLSLALHNTGALLKAGWAYLLVLVAVNFAIGNALMPETGFTTVSYMMEPIAAVDEGAFRTLAALLNLFIGFSIAIAYARHVLIDAVDFPLSFSMRTFRVMIYQVVLGLIGLLSLIPLLIVSSLIAAVTAGLGFVLLFLAPFIALMVVQRFSLVLAATAVDDPMTL